MSMRKQFDGAFGLDRWKELDLLAACAKKFGDHADDPEMKERWREMESLAATEGRNLGAALGSKKGFASFRSIFEEPGSDSVASI
jgi:hypothetical protein